MPMGRLFIWMVFILLSVYVVIPTLIIRVFGFGAFRKGSAPKTAALTFDDGPDPIYTPRLLDLLKKYQVKATFFVVGAKAELYPEMIRRMHQEGHLIGIHNYVHHPNPLMMPWQVSRQLAKASAIIEGIIGKKPLYYRPPWGIFNLFDFLLLKDYRVVLWSSIVGDWRRSTGKDKIKSRLLTELDGGAVILLHDSGDTFGADLDAPEYMLEALEEFLQESITQGYSYSRIDDTLALEQQLATSLSWFKKMLVALWMQWEKLFHRLFHVRPVDSHNPFLHVRVCTYNGKPILLTDGEVIRKGDRVVELHLDNHLLFEMGMQARSSVQLAVQMIRAMEDLLPKLSELMVTDRAFNNVKGVYGISMIHRGTKKFGFSVMNLSSGIFTNLTKIYLKLLMFIVHPQGKKRLDQKKELLTPKMIAISTKQLQRGYGVMAQIETASSVSEEYGLDAAAGSP